MCCLDELVFNRVACCGTAGGDIDLVVDGAKMPLHGAWAEDELVGDLCIGQALGNAPQYFDLPRCKPIRESGG